MPKAIRKYKPTPGLRAKRIPLLQNGATIAEDMGFQQMLDYTIKKKGGKPEQYIDLMNSIAYHETGAQQRMKPDAIQLVTKDGKLQPIGAGRGMFMFEVGDDMGGVTAVNRTVKELKDAGLAVPSWLNTLYAQKSVDFSKLTADQQRFLFLGNYLQHPKANFSKYVNGELSSEDFWFNYHQAGGADVERERRLSWQESEAERKKIKPKKP
jgi:hypothetical protein